jgi:NADH-ubiquinone oxidoreductase chain 1
MTEHAAVIFVFFFLAEYASIVLICILTSILFLGGYLLNIMPILYIFFLFDILTVHFINILDFCYSFINDLLFNKTPVSSSNYSGQSIFSTSIYQYFNGDYIESYINEKESILFNPIFEGIICGIILGIKSCIMIFVFI